MRADHTRCNYVIRVNLKDLSKQSDDLRVAGNPTNVRHASELVVGVDIEDVFDGERGTQKVPAGGVNDTLGLARRS